VIVEFTAGEDVALLGGSHLNAIPLGVSGPIPMQRARELRARAALGAWTEDSRPRLAPSGASIFAPGVRSVTSVPLVWNEQILGVISLASAEVASSAMVDERVATAREFGAVAGALLGPGLAERARREATRTSVVDIIAGVRFHPVFQPIVDLSTSRVVGFEALTRFDDGKRPDLWFADAALAEMGMQLEMATLTAAQVDARRLPADAYLSLNASPALVSALVPILSVLELGGRDVVLEITEQAQIGDYLALRHALDSLRGGVKIAVDDAGAGYAGLRHILEIRPNIVKLDIALVRGVNADPARKAMIASMVTFAAETECKLLAEGIETEEELATLRSLGVELGQGYLLGRPLPIELLADQGQAAVA
jgi:EAL domain-containing protein (putative c-di-GMP-specific phosphodiesterase class I)